MYTVSELTGLYFISYYRTINPSPAKKTSQKSKSSYHKIRVVDLARFIKLPNPGFTNISSYRYHLWGQICNQVRENPSHSRVVPNNFPWASLAAAATHGSIRHAATPSQQCEVRRGRGGVFTPKVKGEACLR